MRKTWMALGALAGFGLIFPDLLFGDNCTGGILDCLNTAGFNAGMAAGGALAAGTAAVLGSDPDEVEAPPADPEKPASEADPNRIYESVFGSGDPADAGPPPPRPPRTIDLPLGEDPPSNP